MAEDAPCSLIVHYEGTTPSAKDLSEALQKGDVQTRINTLKTLIKLQLNGEPQNHFIMTVIKFCVPQEDHTLKKLCIYFWESVDKTDGNGRMLPEMIMVCDFLRKDLSHANEYIRGVTLRFLIKVRERDILENLVSSIAPNLNHADAYVRRHAVLALHAVYARFPQLVPDAPEMVEKLLMCEKDISTRRHALNMLFSCAQERAVRCLAAVRDSSEEHGEAFQLCIVEVVKQLITQNPYDRATYLPFILSALQSKSPSVLYQCASTLLTISSSQTAINNAATTLTQLLTSHNDANAKLIVLDRLVEMKGRFLRVLQDNLMDILRALATAGADLRKRIIDFSVELVSNKNIESFTVAMKKELIRSQTDDIGDADAQQEYRQQLVRAIHTAVIRHLAMAPAVVPIMLDYVCEAGASSYQVVQFIREVAFARPEMQPEIVQRLLGMLPMIASSQVLRTVLWLFTALCTRAEEICALVVAVKDALAPLPLGPEKREGGQDDSGPTTLTTTVVREDGTYVTNMVLVDKKKEVERTDLVGLRAQLVSGDWFLASSLASTLAKLVVRLHHAHANHASRHQMQDVTIDIMNEVLRYGTSALAPAQIDSDNHERIVTSLTIVKNPKNDFLASIVADSVDAFQAVRAAQERTRAQTDAALTGAATDGAPQMGDLDQPMIFTQLSRGKQSLYDFESADDVQNAVNKEDKGSSNSLERIVQLSGFSDLVYAEAVVHVHQFDVLIDLYAVNQTSQTLNNVTVELATTGDLKLCERPQSYVMPPGSALSTKINIKVSSTEKGVVFGSILFDLPSGDTGCVILNEIQIDIMEYIREGTCTPAEFRELWTSFEWENKISIPPSDLDPREYIARLAESTNLRAIEPLDDLDVDYISALMYARSTFGEDVLANVSMERNESGKVEGVVRVRAKTQGIALGLGDKIEGIPKMLRK